MGIETATLMAYAAVAAAGASVYTAATAKSPDTPAPPAPEKPPQAAKAPDVAPLRAKNAGAALMGPLAGNSSTMLTGTSGIDSALLSLGKSTLLGQ
jgi:hypothetical protein